MVVGRAIARMSQTSCSPTRSKTQHLASATVRLPDCLCLWLPLATSGCCSHTHWCLLLRTDGLFDTAEDTTAWLQELQVRSAGMAGQLMVHIYDLFGAYPGGCKVNRTVLDRSCARPPHDWWPALEAHRSFASVRLMTDDLPGKPLRELAAGHSLLMGTDFIDVCPCPTTGCRASLCGPGHTTPEQPYEQIAARQFSFANPDWTTSWAYTQPTPADEFNFELFDTFAVWMKEQNMSFRTNGIMNAHNLRPGTSCPPHWLTDGYRNGSYTKDELKGFLKRRIDAMVPHW